MSCTQTSPQLLESFAGKVSARLASGEMPWSSVLKGFIPNEVWV